MSYWPWWLGGLGLAAVMVGHWLLTHRMMGVSGRVTALVDRARFGPIRDESADMSDAELQAALLAATLEAFGPLPELTAAPPAAPPVPVERAAAPDPPARHVGFFAGLALGGLLSALVGGARPLRWLDGALSTRLSEVAPGLPLAALFVGGVLVGAGTRMAGGCTSGHGLCGVSRLQPGSLASTAAFFGAGALASALLGRLL